MTNNDLHKALEHQFDMLEGYKAREARLVEGLGWIQKALNAGDKEIAADKMRQLLEGDLKQARERVHDWTMALRMAVEKMSDVVEHEGEGYSELEATCKYIKVLAPEAFEKEDNPIGFVENGKFVPMKVVAD